MVGIEIEVDKKYKSKAKCPKCGSTNLLITEVCEDVGTWEQINGTIIHRGYFSAGNIIGLHCICCECEHSWKPRKVNQVTDLYAEEVK